MRISCAVEWRSTDPLVEAHLEASGCRKIGWEIEVVDLSRCLLHEVYRTMYVGGRLVPREEDFRIHQVTRIVVPADPRKYDTEEPVVSGTVRFLRASSIARRLRNILEEDRIVTLWQHGTVSLHHDSREVIPITISVEGGEDQAW